MPVDDHLVGHAPPPLTGYEVTAGKVAEFAAAVGSDYDASDPAAPAPTTFPIVLAFAAMNRLLEDPDVGISLHRVVHGEQRFAVTRPVRAGDVLAARLTVASVRSIGGADIIGTSTQITDADGEHVCTASATLVHRGEES